MRAPVWIKPAIWGVIIGSVGTMMVGFTSMGWTLNSTAQREAQQRAEFAVTAALTPLCVQNFMKQSDATRQLTDLRDIDSWKRQEFVEKGGWATIPGSKVAAPGVANACAEALLKAKT